MKRSKQEYIDFDPCADDRDVDVRCRTVKIVRVRKQHTCVFNPEAHQIEKGDLARYEKALADGRWGSYYCCIPCLDKWLDELYGEAISKHRENKE